MTKPEKIELEATIKKIVETLLESNRKTSHVTDNGCFVDEDGRIFTPGYLSHGVIF